MLTLRFDQIEETACDQAGGKGYTLARLRQAGFPVPPGFVVTAEAYRAVIAANGLDVLIADAVACGDPASASARIEAAFEEAEIPSVVATAIHDAYLALGEGEVAVRSSALTEDSDIASFAGQYETVLDVIGPNSLVGAVRCCWASLWSEWVLAYRACLPDASNVPAMAVVVQRMVPAAQAGVALTLDPVTGRRDIIVVEAVEGSGDALTGGRTTPHRYVVSPDGGCLQDDTGVLDAARLESVARLVQGVETWAGRPQDVEWVLDDTGQLHLLQARPITILGSSEVGGAIRWTRDNVGEVIPEPVTPLSWSVLEPLGNSAFAGVLRRLGVSEYPDGGLFGRFYGRVYFNQTLFQAMMGRFYISRTGWQALPRLMWSALRALLLLRRLPAESQESIQVIAEHRRSKRDLAFWRRLSARAMEAHLAVSAMAELLYQALDKLLNLWDVDAIAVTALTAGLTGVRSAEAGQALAALAGEICRDRDLRTLMLTTDVEDLHTRLSETVSGRRLWAQIEAFLAQHGHSAAQEFELAAPRWRDDPTIILKTLRTQLCAEGRAPPADPGKARREAVARVERELSWPQRVVFRHVLRWTQSLTVSRENLKYHIVIAVGHLRDLYLAQAETLVAAEQLARSEDIIFLTADEVADLAEGALMPDESEKRVAERRQNWEAAKRVTSPFALDQLADGRLQTVAMPSAVSDEDIPLLRGFAASPGVYTGRARVVLTPEDGAKLEPGEVLVTPATSPGWAPVLLSAGALITEIGGTLSHGAIIAREYGLPAVLNVADATQRIRSGQMLQVDGGQGLVQLLEEAA
jgi:phosphohistidine swiveling domain-containing protein